MGKTAENKIMLDEQTMPAETIEHIVDIMERTKWGFDVVFDSVREDWFCGDAVPGLETMDVYLVNDISDPPFPPLKSALKRLALAEIKSRARARANQPELSLPNLNPHPRRKH